LIGLFTTAEWGNQQEMMELIHFILETSASTGPSQGWYRYVTAQDKSKK
jgi:hypothetical protein